MSSKTSVKDLKKLTPEQKARIELQEVQSALQAPLQFGTDKFLINVNGKNSKIKSNNNAIVKYTLEQPIKLDIGDRVTLLDSFVEERGLAIDTISINDDIEEEIRFLYYMQGDLRNSINVAGQEPQIGLGADQEFAPYPAFYQDCQTPDTNPNLKGGQIRDNTLPLGRQGYSLLNMPAKFMTCFPQQNYIDRGANCNMNLFGVAPGTDGFGGEPFATTGANGQPYYLMEMYNPYENGVGDGFPANALEQQDVQKIWYRPLYGSTKIKVPAGNYSVSALADLINKQLNGSITREKTGIQVDRLTDKLHYNTDEYGFQQTIPFFKGTASKSFREESNVTPVEFNPDVEYIGADTHQGFQRRKGDIVTPMYFNPNLAGNQINFTNFRKPVDGTPVDNTLTYRYRNNTRLNDANTQNFDKGTIKNPWWLGDPSIASGLGTSVIANNYDRTLWNPNSSNDQKYYRFNNNFYLHLDGLRAMFNEDFYYGNKNFTETGSYEYYEPTYMPTLGDTLQCRQGGRGAYYRDNDVQVYNFHGYPEEELKHPEDRKYFYDNKPEDYQFQALFPCVGSMNTGSPKNIAELDASTTIGTFQQFAGTTAFNIAYDTGKTNRFSISNLHEPYKLPSRTPDNKNDTHLGGQQGTMFNSPMFFRTIGSSAGYLPQVLPPSPNCGIYPIDSAGGIAVNNFSFSTIKETNIYKNLIAEIAQNNTSNAYFQCRREKLIYDLFTKPYDEFFNSEDEAKEAWSKTLWSRLGFSYEQLGNVSNNLEKIYTFTNPPAGDNGIFDPVINPRIIRHTGIVTHNQFNYTFIPSSSGLGVGNPYFSTSSESLPQNYGLRAYSSSIDLAVIKPLQGYAIDGAVQNNIHILCDSEPINAESFPSLNDGDNYFLIESDIVKRNAKDSNSNDTTIVAVMSKENATNDTIFSINPITFSITEPKLLASIEVRIKNPDGSLASSDIIGKNNGFVFQVEKSIKPATIPMQSF